MTKKDSQKPAFFEEGATDPVAIATGVPEAAQETAPNQKRKAGFYLSQGLLDRFNTKFYELKLAGVSIENKSGLLELALEFALDDLDKEEAGELMARIKK